MTTFHIIHLIIGIWLAVANFVPLMAPEALAANNGILAIIIAVFNAYYLFAQRNVDVAEG